VNIIALYGHVTYETNGKSADHATHQPHWLSSDDLSRNSTFYIM